MNTLRGTVPVFRREFSGYFRTPVAYVYLTVFILGANGLPWFVGNFFESDDASLRIFFNFLPWLYLFLIPAVGMRLWAEEKRLGTIELLLTLPVSPGGAVLGKFLAAWAFIGLALVLTFPMPLTIGYLGSPDWGPVFTGYAGALLMAGAYLGICILASALTQNQVIAFVLGVAGCLLLLLLGWSLFNELLLSTGLPAGAVDALANFGFIPRFQPLVDGVIHLADLLYFLSLPALCLTLNKLVFRSQPALKKLPAPALFATALVLFAAVNLLAVRLPWRLDLTGDRLYSVSRETAALLTALPEPVTLRFFFSRSTGDLPTMQKNYGRRVERMLRRYVALAPQKLTLTRVEPLADTPAEEEALQAGLSALRLPSGDAFFFGLEFTAGDRRQVIPFFQPRREPFLEYDLSQALRQLLLDERPLVGVLTGQDLFAPPPPVALPRPEQSLDSVFIKELRRHYEVRALGRESIPEDLDLLLIIHPRAISAAQQFSIDQFLLRGKPVFLAVDPSAATLRQKFPDEARLAALGGRISSDLPDLLTGWGIRYHSRQVVGDPTLATEINPGQNQPVVRFPLWMTFRQFNRDLAPTAALREILIAEGGSFRLRQDHLHLHPILTTSPRSGEMMASALTVVPAAEVDRQLTRDNQERVVAGLITGRFRSAFPEGPPDRDQPGALWQLLEPENGQHLRESSGESTLFLIADSDFLTDPFSVQPVTFMGQSGVAPVNDNLALALNLIDFLVGDQRLLGLRGKGSATRPFAQVARLRAAADEQYRSRLQTLETRLRAVREEMGRLQTETGDPGTVFPPGMADALEEFRQSELSLRVERRQLRRALHEQTVLLERSLIAFNLLAIPVAILLYSLFHFWRRRSWEHRRQAHRPSCRIN